MAFKLLRYQEHNNCIVQEIDTILFSKEVYQYDFKKRRGDQPCYAIIKREKDYHLSLSYYIGVDWIEENEMALYVEPKLNTKQNDVSDTFSHTDTLETDYIKMLFGAIKHPEVSIKIDELFEIKWNQPQIQIDQKQDLLTPLLVVQFLNLLKKIVRKGLKKSYYKVENNLYGKVKGKILSAKTIKNNILNNKVLNAYCAYEEFGLNGLENRLLKRTLVFINRYLPGFNSLQLNDIAPELFNYILPAFETISEEVELNEIKFTKINAFYKEYEEAITLAKLILKRFGYNLSNTESKIIYTPPFWIDMSKLFELYVLGLLKDRFSNHREVTYRFYKFGNELDYLLNTADYKMVADAKYKTKYQFGHWNEDIRQVSGYSRLKEVYDELNKPYSDIIDCLIIYPDQESGLTDLLSADLKEAKIDKFVQIYKVGIKLPTIKT